MTDEQLERLRPYGRVIAIDQGDFIFHAGDDASEFVVAGFPRAFLVTLASFDAPSNLRP